MAIKTNKIISASNKEISVDDLVSLNDNIDKIKSDIENKLISAGKQLKPISSKTIKISTINNSYLPHKYNNYAYILTKLTNNTLAYVTLIRGNNIQKNEIVATVFSINDGIVSKKKSTGLASFNTNQVNATRFITLDYTGKVLCNNYQYYTGSNYTGGFIYGIIHPNGNVTSNNYTTSNYYTPYTYSHSGGMYDSNGTGFYAIVNNYYNNKAYPVKVNYTNSSPNFSYQSIGASSCSYNAIFIPQIGVSNSGIVGISYYYNNSRYYERAYNASGSYKDYLLPIYGYNHSLAFVLSNGKVLNINRLHSGYNACVYSDYQDREIIDININFNMFYPYFAINQITNVDKDTWIVFNPNNHIIYKLHIDPDTYKISILDSIFVGEWGLTTYSAVKVAGENNELLVITDGNSNSVYENIRIFENPFA